MCSDKGRATIKVPVQAGMRLPCNPVIVGLMVKSRVLRLATQIQIAIDDGRAQLRIVKGWVPGVVIGGPKKKSIKSVAPRTRSRVQMRRLAEEVAEPGMVSYVAPSWMNHTINP